MSARLPCSTALTKRLSDTDLMPPPPPSKRIKRPPKVLDEDTYTNALSHIIARDFFPGLLETETQQEYLDALEAGDAEWIEDAGQRVRVAMTPVARGRRRLNMTPSRRDGLGDATPRDWRGETPRSSTPSQVGDGESGLHQDEEQAIDLSMGLSAFQAKYTSEDNESFNKVLDRQNAKRAEKYRWMWTGNKIPSARQIAQAARQQRRLQASSASSKSSTDLAFDPTSQSLALIPQSSQDLDLRPAMINHTAGPPRNNFMFAPDDLIDTHPHHQTIADAAASKSSAPPKAVNYNNTRLPISLLTSDNNSIPQSPSLSAIDAAIIGHTHHRPSSTILSTTPGSETPRVNGYAFVDAEPSPSELGRSSSPPTNADDSLLQQLITVSSNTGTNPFTIHASTAREALHHRMVEKTSAAKRTPRTTPLQPQASSSTTQTPRFMSSPRILRTPGIATRIGSRLAGGDVGGWENSGSVTPRTGDGRVKKEVGALTPAARQLYGMIDRRGVDIVGGEAFAFEGERGRGKEKGSWTPKVLGVKRTVKSIRGMP